MEKKELEKILEKIREAENLLYDIKEELVDSLFYNDFKEIIERILNKKDGLTFYDMAISIWLETGGLELANKEDYRNQLKFIDLESTLRTVLTKMQDESDEICVEGIGKGMKKNIEYIYKKNNLKKI